MAIKEINVVSWNMQGWGNKYQNDGVPADEKILMLINSLRNFIEGSTVIMLQECGDPEKTGLIKNKTWKGPDGEIYRCLITKTDPLASIRGKRCSTAILVSEKLTVSTAVELSLDGARPMVYVVINKMRFGTLHAIADESQSVTQVKSYLDLLAAGNDKWILMGDFNSRPEKYVTEKEKQYLRPEKLNDVAIRGTTSRPSRACKMIFSGQPTQGMNGQRKASLDFAFLSDNFKEEDVIPYDGARMKVMNQELFAGSGKYLSDHNLIGLKLAIDFDEK